jgi:protocatechuate 3,4-dioxygenase, alpha subunit
MTDDRGAAPLATTPAQTVGPFFRVCLAQDAEYGRLLGEETDRIALVIRVTDGAGAPVNDALLEIWQADGVGRAWAFGRLSTDEDGCCEFDTMQPAAPPTGAAHINVCVFARGLLRHLFTRVYFEGDERLATDPVLTLVPDDRRRTLIARRSGTQTRRWIFDIHLQGQEETVFFDA